MNVVRTIHVQFSMELVLTFLVIIYANAKVASKKLKMENVGVSSNLSNVYKLSSKVICCLRTQILMSAV